MSVPVTKTALLSTLLYEYARHIIIIIYRSSARLEHFKWLFSVRFRSNKTIYCRRKYILIIIIIIIIELVGRQRLPENIKWMVNKLNMTFWSMSWRHLYSSDRFSVPPLDLDGKILHYENKLTENPRQHNGIFLKMLQFSTWVFKRSWQRKDASKSIISTDAVVSWFSK